MVKKFLNSLVLIMLLNFLVKPLWIFGIDMTVQNRVGPEAYGLYFGLLNLSFLINILLDLGIINFNNRQIAQHPEQIADRFGALASIKLVLAIFYAMVLFGVTFLLGYDAYAFKLVALLAVNQFLLSFILFLRSNISGLQLFRTDALLSVIDKLAMIGMVGWLLFSAVGQQWFSIEAFIISQTFAFLITVVIGWSVLYRRGAKFHWTFSVVSFKAVIRETWPYALLILLMGLHNKVDGVMLERLAGAKSAGIYAAAYRLIEAFTQVGFLFAVLLLPMFSRLISTREKVQPLLLAAFSIAITLAIGAIVPGVVFSYELMALFYVHEIFATAATFMWLVGGFAGYIMSYVFGSLLTANGSLRTLNRIAAIGLSINVVMNLVLIPTFGTIGAAITTLITQLLTALAQLYVCNKRFPLGFSPQLYFQLFGTIALTVITALLLKWVADFGVVSALLAAGSALIWAWITGLVNPKKISALS